VLGVSKDGAMSTLFAATYPERAKVLATHGAYAHYPIWVLQVNSSIPGPLRLFGAQV
jgi:hypothetical protein